VFIVTHGALDVFVADDGASRRVAGMGPGEVVGDMAFLTGEPRSASIRAAVDSACLVLRAADLKLMAFEHPTVLLRMARVLVRRLPERWSPAAA
jgi:CRP-like cAMP-binding protein